MIPSPSVNTYQPILGSVYCGHGKARVESSSCIYTLENGKENEDLESRYATEKARNGSITLHTSATANALGWKRPLESAKSRFLLLVQMAVCSDLAVTFLPLRGREVGAELMEVCCDSLHALHVPLSEVFELPLQLPELLVLHPHLPLEQPRRVLSQGQKNQPTLSAPSKRGERRILLTLKASSSSFRFLYSEFATFLASSTCVTHLSKAIGSPSKNFSPFRPKRDFRLPGI